MTWHQTVIVGNLGQDAELKYMQNGTAICNFSVAVTEKWSKDGQKQERTTWHKVAVFGKLGESLHQYLKKGKQVLVSGTPSVSAYIGKDGEARASLELRAQEIRLLGSQDSRPDNVSDMPKQTPPPPNGDTIPF